MKVRAVVSGAGTGAGFAAKALASLSDVTLEGIFAPSATRRDPLCAELGCRPFTRFDEMLATRPDFVVISCPNHVRERQVTAVVESNVDFVVDKPVSHSRSSFAKIVTMLSANRHIFPGVLHQHSRNPAVCAATEAIRRGDLGTLLGGQISLQWGRFGGYLDSRFKAINNDGVENNQAPHPFHAAIMAGGASLPDLRLGESPVVSVFAARDRRSHEDDPRCEVNTTASGMFTLQNGVSFTFFTTAGCRADAKWSVKFTGTHGRIEVREDGVVVRDGTKLFERDIPTDYPLEGTVESDGAPNAGSDPAGSRFALHADFFRHWLIRRETSRESGFAHFLDGCATTALTLAIGESADSGRAVKPIDFSHLLP